MNHYRICTRCVMDSTDTGIDFDAKGQCNHCRRHRQLMDLNVLRGQAAEFELKRVTEQIKAAGKGREYDCILGLSGGLDSSFVAYHAKRLGLRPLAVHFDNGWNSELAVKNIESIVNKLGFDLFTYVINWEEFRDLQLAFIRASVVDIEMLTDHAITASIYKLASSRRISTILSGTNWITEGIMPKTWAHRKSDLTNILSIHKRFGKRPLKTYPTASTVRLGLHRFVRGIRFVEILNFVPYVKAEATALLESEIGWRDYGGKHFESVFTRFYQAYILPTKFFIDKRRAHYSALISSGQMTREEALHRLEMPLYSAGQLADDQEFVLKKLGLSRSEFDLLMQEPPRSHLDYPSDEKLVRFAQRADQRIQRILGRKNSILTPATSPPMADTSPDEDKT